MVAEVEVTGGGPYVTKETRTLPGEVGGVADLMEQLSSRGLRLPKSTAEALGMEACSRAPARTRRDGGGGGPGGPASGRRTVQPARRWSAPDPPALPRGPCPTSTPACPSVWA